MTDLLSIMFDVITPIFVVIGIAAWVGHRLRPDPRGLSTFIVYVFIPALAFQGISQSDLAGDELLGIAGVAVGIALAMVGIGLAVARWLRFDRQLESAFVISVVLINAANYGIPLNQFAFGDEGGQRALIYYVVTVMIGNVFGVYFASRGQTSVRDALWNIIRVPITPAAVLGIIANLADFSLPLPLERSVGILAQAAIPGMLALLGLQLAHTSLDNLRWRPILMGTAMRLLIAPLIALPIALALGLTGVSFKVAIVQSSMPTAVLATALATEFKSDSQFTSTITLISTLASILTLTVLLSLLMD